MAFQKRCNTNRYFTIHSGNSTISIEKADLADEIFCYQKSVSWGIRQCKFGTAIGS